MIRVSLKTDPVTRSLPGLYGGVSVTVRRLRSPEWSSARVAAQATLQDDSQLLPLLVEHDLLPEGGVRGWKRMRDDNPAAYAVFLAGVQQWLTAVECALVGGSAWTGIMTEDGPAPVTREVLQALVLDETLRDFFMDTLTEAALLLVVEGEPSGVSPNGSSGPGKTA